MIPALSVYALPQLGKPDAALPKPQGNDTRARVIQKSTSGICWYSAFNLLRERYKSPNSDEFKGRKFEILASNLKKSIDRYNLDQLGIKATLELSQFAELAAIVTKENLTSKNGLQLRVLLEGVLNGYGRLAGWSLKDIIIDFENQDAESNFYKYLTFRKDNVDNLVHIYRDFFTAQQIDIDSKIEEFSGIKIANLSSQQKYMYLNIFTINTCASSYRFKSSSWTRNDSIADLGNEIQTHGPLIVGGFFGRNYYDVLPYEREFLLGRTVYAWKKEDARSTLNRDRHVILLIGVKKEANLELVYYMDSSDESDPQDPSKQKIYVMSYARLISPDSISMICAPEARYAYYLPKNER